MPPHVFAIAESAYYNMKAYHDNQCVIISGESGSGKTESAKILLRYLAEVSTSSESDLHKRVLQTNPIMESFGCAKTLWNNNSSRFGKLLLLYIESVYSGKKSETWRKMLVQARAAKDLAHIQRCTLEAFANRFITELYT